MRVLALETSSRESSVAVLDDDRLLGETLLRSDQRTAQDFAPAIVRQLETVGWRPSELELIVVSQGPGSFTGLRVGVTAAKTLAYATGSPLLGVNTLAVIATQASGDWQEVTAVGDAQRQQLYVASFRCDGHRVDMVVSTRILAVDSWLESLGVGGCVTGPGLVRLLDRLPVGVRATPAEVWTPRAATLGRIGFYDYIAGRRDELWSLVPRYYRQSAAEEKLADRQND